MKNIKLPIYVTKPYLPPLEELNECLQDIWQSKIITNQGKYHQELEKALCEYLGVKYVSLFANGTLALIVALKALNITGSVITTPFSFVATANALWWNQIKPVFVDIEDETFNLDPKKIEKAIKGDTSAILAVHVYGHPCNIQGIKTIAEKKGLKVLFDAAHAFGVSYNNESILNYGNISVLSFHATKVYNTFEGGAIICHDAKTKKDIDNLKNFGFVNETMIVSPGMNAKMNEFQAALGLLQLKYVDQNILKRKAVNSLYREKLGGIKGICLQKEMPDFRYNYAYFPIRIKKDLCVRNRDYIYEELKKYHIYTRRYFYPLISQFEIYKNFASSAKGKTPVAERVAEEVLCLPMYPELNKYEIDYIATAIKRIICNLK